MLVHSIALFVTFLAEVEVLTVLAVISYVYNRLHLAVVALIVGKHIAWLIDLFSKIFLRSIGESFALCGLGDEMI